MSEAMYWFFLISLLLIMFFSFKIKWKTEGCINIIDPFTVFSAGFFIYVSVGIFDQQNSFKYSFYVFLMFWLSAILGYAAFSLGYIFNTKKFKQLNEIKKIKLRFTSTMIHNWKLYLPDLAMLFLFLLFIGINFDVFYNMIANFGSGLSYSAVAIRGARSATSGPLSLLESYFTMILLGYPCYRMYKSSTISLVDLGLIIILGTYSMASGYRVTLISIFFAILVLFNFKRKLIKIWQIIFAGSFMLMFMVALGHLRIESNIFDMFEMFQSATNLVRVTGSGEFSNTVQTMLDYILYISDGTYDFNLGYTWIVEILLYIPYFLFPDRPLPWPEQYMLDFYPFALSGTGHGWFILNDGYMSLGIVGVFIELFVLGIVFAKVNSYFIKRINNPVLLFMYAILNVYSLLIVRGSFLSGIKNYILDMLPLIVLLIMFKSNKRYLIDNNEKNKRNFMK